MLIVPPESELDGSYLFQDSGDAALNYLDPTQPGPARGDRVVRWLALDKGRFQFAAEVSFGYREAAAQAITKRRPHVRLTAMPWQTSPVIAFAVAGGQARVVARGQTSGFGAHNAILNAIVAGETTAAPLTIAAELSCPALLTGARLVGESRTTDIVPMLQQITLGPHAPAEATLADVLLAFLRRLLQQDMVALRLMEGSGLSLGAPAALKEAALLYWAKTIADACLRGASLAGPAQQAHLDGSAEPELSFDWRAGTTIPWRAIRRLTASPATTADVSVAEANSSERGPKLSVRASGAWDQFDFVTVTLGGRELTLTAAAPEAAVPNGAAAGEQPRAVGALSGHGATIPLPARADGATIQVSLPALVETALLVRADRRLVEQVGPLDVSLDHPGLAAQLMPRGRTLRLALSDDDRPTVSGVYRALLRRAQAALPYEVTVAPAHGAAVSWSADGQGERLEIGRDRLPVLDVVVAATSGHAVAVEAAQGPAEARQTLGRREASGGDLIHWVYRPDGNPLWLRTTQNGYTTGWRQAKPDGAIVAPQVSAQPITLHGGGHALEVEVKSAAGAGEAERRLVAPGQEVAVSIMQDSGVDAFLVRQRPAGEELWSEWRPANGHVLRLEALAN